ncbi:glucuronate isomerase [Schumannella luteola]|uniref:Uronate isomerase n=1 Tax=Schumannella luteola TaxID=472059 RepID=A0A852Y8Q2_9MICO|nr:glucuronate isomerase [Schumannella luteola]TPX01444.1 glucuronate isomerase [Schumannella luteola]
MPMTLRLDPDRLLPADPATREVARSLYASTAELPIVSPHGHVDPRLIFDDQPFPNPAELFIRYDHYVTRLMHAAGVELADLGIPAADGRPIAEPRQVWRIFCTHWGLYAGTASGYWLQHTFSTLFDIDEHPSAENADALYDRIQAALETPEFRPRALFARFGIEVLATTDDPLDDLAVHAALAADPTFTGRVVPTFRPDGYINPLAPGYAENVRALAAWGDYAVDDYAGYLRALEHRRRHFVEHGAVSADFGVPQPYTVDLGVERAAALYAEAVSGSISAADARELLGHMLLESARMSVDDGLVMTIHPGVFRNHSSSTFQAYGPDTGHDIPVAVEYVENLRPLLERYGNHADLHLVLFAIDETVYSREIAPLAGFYRSVYVGAPWWFIDAPDAVLRFRAAVTETAGFSRGSGFIDDTRAFLSIPARHDMSRRLDAAFLARLVVEGRIDRAAAEQIAGDLVVAQPTKVFKL